MAEYRNTHTGPIDLDDGRVLAPGEAAEIDISVEHNKTLADLGRLLPVETSNKVKN